MALPVQKNRFTVAEYLTQEERAVERHEFHAGEILAMSGGTYEHSRIVANLIRSLGNRLDGSPGHVVDSNLRVGLDHGERYVYPDASIICGPPAFDPADAKRTTILNPKVVIEVLSDSTEAYDRGQKFAHYRTVPPMVEYVLVSQRVAAVETFFRGEDGSWSMRPVAGLDATVPLRGVPIDLPLAELYAGIVFPPEPDVSTEERVAEGNR